MRERRRQQRAARAEAIATGTHSSTSKRRLRTRTARALESAMAFRRCGGTPAEPIVDPATFLERSRLIELIEPMYGAEPRDAAEACALERLLAERDRQQTMRERTAEAERVTKRAAKEQAQRDKARAAEAHRMHLRNRHVARRERIECLVLQDPECTFMPDTSGAVPSARRSLSQGNLNKTVDGNVPWRGI